MPRRMSVRWTNPEGETVGKWTGGFLVQVGLLVLAGVPAPGACAETPGPRVAYNSALLGCGKRWGKMVEAQGKLFAMVGSGVVRLDLASGRWKVLVEPQKHSDAKVYSVRAGKSHVYFAGGHVDGDARRPLLWRLDAASEKLRELPIEDALRKAGLAKYDGVRDVVEAGGSLWLSMSRRDYEGPLLDYPPATGVVRPAPPVPEGGIEVGWSGQIVGDGDAVLAVGRVRSGDYVLWRLDARRRVWTRRPLPHPKGRPYFRKRLLRRPGEWWGVAQASCLVAVAAAGSRCIAGPEAKGSDECEGGVFLDERTLLLWGPRVGRKLAPRLYRVDKRQWVVSAPVDEKEGIAGSSSALYPSDSGAWLAHNYTLYRISAAAVRACLDGRSPQEALASYFAGPYVKKGIAQIELEELARRHTVQTWGAAYVDADEAAVYDKKGGRVVRRLPLGSGLFIRKWLDGHAQLVGPGVKTLTPHPRLVDEAKLSRKPAGWQAVLLPDRTRGWMRGDRLFAHPLWHVDAAPAAKTLTVRLSPRRDTAQTRVATRPRRAYVRDLVEITRGAGRTELWASLDRIVAGNPPLCGWVAAGEIQLGFVAVQRAAAQRWRQQGAQAKGAEQAEARRKARTLLERMARECKDTAFLHRGIFDGGGPRECHAGYQARFDLAVCYSAWGEPAKAIAIYDALAREKTDADAYQGKVPAWAAFQKALLLESVERYDAAIVAYRRVVLRHAGQYWASGMYLPADQGVLHRLKEICVSRLKDPARWRSEATALRARLKDARLRKILDRLARP